MLEGFECINARTVEPPTNPHPGRVGDPRVPYALEERDLKGVRVRGAVGAPLGEPLAADDPRAQLRLGGVGHEVLELCRVSGALTKADLSVPPTLGHVLEAVLELIDAVHYGHGTRVAAELEADVHFAPAGG